MSFPESESEVEMSIPDIPTAEIPVPEMIDPVSVEEVITFAEGVPILGDRPWYLRPEPNWTSLSTECGLNWEVHCYSTASVFLLLFLLSLYHLIRVIKMPHSIAKPYYIALQALLLICGASRAVHFFPDAYHSTGHLPLVISFMTLHIYDPCILSAFLLVYVALVKVTRMQTLSVTEYLIRPAFLIFVTALNFLVVLSTDVLVAFVMGTSLYKFICQLYFVIFGLVASGFYCFLFCRIYTRVYLTRVKINRMSNSHQNPKSRKRGPSGNKLLNVGTKLPISGKEVETVKSIPIKDVMLVDESSNSEEDIKESSLQPSSHGSSSPSVQSKSSDDSPDTTSTPLCKSTPQKTNSGKTEHPKEPHKTESISENGIRPENIKIDMEPTERTITRCQLRKQSGIPDIVEARVPIAAKLVLLAAGVFMLLSLCNILFTILSAMRVCESNTGVPASWYWLGYQITMRMLELILVAVIAIIAAMPIYDMS